MVGQKSICIITNAPISQNPRSAKEADCLVEAGYKVTVIGAQYASWTVKMDQSLAVSGKWKLISISVDSNRIKSNFTRLVVLFRTKLFGLLARVSTAFPIAELAYSRFFIEQLWCAVKCDADLYIAHNPPSVSIAFWAARIRRKPFAFDSEDLHTGEYPDDRKNSVQYKLLQLMENKYLKLCCYVSAASPGIGDELRKRYQITNLVTILNTFPWSDRGLIPMKEISKDRHQDNNNFSLYWYSQIISLDRGLQSVIEAIQDCPNVELHIRGEMNDETYAVLMSIMDSAQVTDRVFFHKPVPPEKLLAYATQHDIGLCLELPETLNRDICITNKLFLYLLAGLAIIATDTQGQKLIFKQNPHIGLVVEGGKKNALSSAIKRMADDTDFLHQCQQASLLSAKSTWNWERESQIFLEAVRASTADY